MNMYNSSLTELDEAADKRIIREEYRNHDLVARYWEYGYLGKIWKNRKAIEEIDAESDESLEDLVQRMKAHVDALILEKSRARNNRSPSRSELEEAFHGIESRFTALEKLLLKYCAENCGEEGVTIKHLQRLLNLNSTDSIHELLGRIGNKLNDELGYEPKATRDRAANVRVLLAPSDQEHIRLNVGLHDLVKKANW